MNDPENHTEYKIRVKDCILIAYSGIRGAFPLIVCLTIARDEDYDPQFRALTMFITIMVIALGLLFNGMTMKFLISTLNLIPKNEITEKVKNMIKKEILVKSYDKIRELKKSKEFRMANWGLVKDLTVNDKSMSQYIYNNMNKKNNSFLLTVQNNLNEVLTEIRLRMIFMVKNQIFTNLQNSSCTAECATTLLEVTRLIMFRSVILL
jgi:hypothetical protein